MENENIHYKTELLENISELFLTYGLRSTSMDDICNHLKISKKTLYQFFENKDDVVEQVMLFRREKKRKENNINEFIQMNSVHFLFGIKTHIINDLSSRLPANLFDMKKYHPEVAERISAEDCKFITNILTTVLNNGIQTGVFRKDMDMDVQIHLFGKQMSFLGEPETMNAMEYSIPVVIGTIIDNFIKSLCTEKGMAEFECLKEEEKMVQNL